MALIPTGPNAPHPPAQVSLAQSPQGTQATNERLSPSTNGAQAAGRQTQNAHFSPDGHTTAQDIQNLASPGGTGNAVSIRGNDPQQAIDQGRGKQIATRIKTLQQGLTGFGDEKEILNLLKGASPGAFSEALSQLDLHELFEDVDNHFIGPDNLTALLNMMSQDRLGDLSVPVRAQVVSALQKGRTDDLAEKTIQKVFLGTKGGALTELKNRIDKGGDNEDLMKLIFTDIDDAPVRKSILAHIAKEAPSKIGDKKVMSDIDDTFYANLKDQRYPKKTRYPGVLQFYQELDRGLGNESKGNMIFLTARPSERTGAVENFSHDSLQGMGAPEATILGGSMDPLDLVSNARMGEHKVVNFEKHKQLFPEYDYVFAGDSGQGDALAGLEMRQKDSADIPAVFINDVVNTPASVRASHRQKGVYFNDTYAGAAVDAFDQGLVSKEGMARVGAQAAKEFGTIAFENPQQKAAASSDLQKDLTRMNALLDSSAQIAMP